MAACVVRDLMPAAARQLRRRGTASPSPADGRPIIKLSAPADGSYVGDEETAATERAQQLLLAYDTRVAALTAQRHSQLMRELVELCRVRLRKGDQTILYPFNSERVHFLGPGADAIHALRLMLECIASERRINQDKVL